MDPRIRRAALRYAAKTAIVVSLSGCYDSHGRPPRAVALVDAAVARTDAPVWADVPPPDAPPSLPDVGPVECEPLLASLAITDPDPMEDRWHWGATFTDPAVHTDPAVGECCLAMEIRASEDPVGGAVDIGSPLAMACCEVIVGDQHLVSSSSLGCTPWGPPCPPEMPAEDVA
jgi:hypothetical protein